MVSSVKSSCHIQQTEYRHLSLISRHQKVIHGFDQSHLSAVELPVCRLVAWHGITPSQIALQHASVQLSPKAWKETVGLIPAKNFSVDCCMGYLSLEVE